MFCPSIMQFLGAPRQYWASRVQSVPTAVANGCGRQIGNVDRQGVATRDRPSNERALIAAKAPDDSKGLVPTQMPPSPLYKELWKEIATFGSRHDILHLRTTSAEMAEWVDTAITRLEVCAENLDAMLAVIGKTSRLTHLRELHIRDCTSTHIKTVANLLPAQLPPKLNISITSRPHSAGAHDNDLHALAALPQLTSLSIAVTELSDAAAQAFGEHAGLTELRLISRSPIAMSAKALNALASSSTLRTLDIGDTKYEVGPEAIAALTHNRTLQSLSASTFNHPFGAHETMQLSGNKTLKTLVIVVNGGCGHLAKMSALQALTLCGAVKIHLEDARQFKQSAHLTTLDITGIPFESGALAIIVGSAVENLSISATALTHHDIKALLENRALRSLHCKLRMDFLETVSHAIALAGCGNTG